MLPSTKFAPAERAEPEILLQQSSIIEDNSLVTSLLNALPDICFLLNQQRQIVWVNEVALSFSQLETATDLQGMRPGEFMKCIHSFNGAGGCGTTKECSCCGAIMSVLASMKDGRADKECRLQCVNSRGIEAKDLRVACRTIHLSGEAFTLAIAHDISSEKRRLTLERMFFHDVLNTAGAVRSLLDMVNDQMVSFGEIKEDLDTATDSLIRDLSAQQQLLQAESDELVTQEQSISSISILETVRRRFAQHRVAQGKQLKLSPFTRQFTLETDPALLERIIGNLTKNALEAVGKGQLVSLGADIYQERATFWCHNPGVMTDEQQMQVFQRNYSTKGSGRGLGTYSVKLLTERYLHGHVTFVSTPESGTVFMVELPTR